MSSKLLFMYRQAGICYITCICPVSESDGLSFVLAIEC